MDPLHGMTCPFLSDRNPLWTPWNLTSRHFFSSETIHLPRFLHLTAILHLPHFLHLIAILHLPHFLHLIAILHLPCFLHLIAILHLPHFLHLIAILHLPCFLHLTAIIFCTSLLSYTATFSAPHCYLTPAMFSAPHCYLPSPQVSVIHIGSKLKVNILTVYREEKKEEQQNQITNFPEEWTTVKSNLQEDQGGQVDRGHLWVLLYPAHTHLHC